jgi:hypothetical protein
MFEGWDPTGVAHNKKSDTNNSIIGRFPDCVLLYENFSNFFFFFYIFKLFSITQQQKCKTKLEEYQN